MAAVTSVDEVSSHAAFRESVAGIGTFVDLVFRARTIARSFLFYDTPIAKITA
jgi:hypothetical protein